MTAIFSFGEVHPDYSVRVLNEREARAGAGILLLPGIAAFLNAFQNGDFTATRLVMIAFLVDFAIRVLINPRFAPSLILGRLIVRGQAPEYTGAPQKRFAWGLGLGIAVAMVIWNIGMNLAGPFAILGCLACILLLYSETAFGICIGCRIYNAIWPGQAQLCPGGVCEITPRAPITRLGVPQYAVLLAFVAALTALAPQIAALDGPRMFRQAQDVSQPGNCEVPAFAKAMGHEEKWKLHNGCL
jgi:hypothetical protein